MFSRNGLPFFSAQKPGAVEKEALNAQGMLGRNLFVTVDKDALGVPVPLESVGHKFGLKIVDASVRSESCCHTRGSDGKCFCMKQKQLVASSCGVAHAGDRVCLAEGAVIFKLLGGAKKGLAEVCIPAQEFSKLSQEVQDKWLSQVGMKISDWTDQVGRAGLKTGPLVITPTASAPASLPVPEPLPKGLATASLHKGNGRRRFRQSSPRSPPPARPQSPPTCPSTTTTRKLSTPSTLRSQGRARRARHLQV